MYILIPFIMFVFMVIVGQWNGEVMLYSLIPLILIFAGVICQTDINNRKEEVKYILGK